MRPLSTGSLVAVAFAAAVGMTTTMTFAPSAVAQPAAADDDGADVYGSDPPDDRTAAAGAVAVPSPEVTGEASLEDPDELEGGDDDGFDDFDDFDEGADEGEDDGFDAMVEEAKAAGGGLSLDGLAAMVPGLEMRWGGRIQADLRFRLEDKSVGEWFDRRPWRRGIARNENLFGLSFAAAYGMVSAKADIDFVLYGFIQDVEDIADLSRRELTDPYRFDVQQLYVKLEGLGLDGLDVSVGHQQTLWGVGDQFNPTNNVNPDDVEDVLLFGDQRGQFMVKADYYITNDWSLTGILVPVFQPALLPRSGRLGLALVDRVPVADPFLRRR
ncbi:MAG: hypothetical protein AAF928_17420, partial [Myxococcota bacterium]